MVAKTTYPTEIDYYNKKPRIEIGKQINWWRRKSVTEEKGGSFNLNLYSTIIDIKQRMG